MKFNFPFNNFSAGEWSPKMSARVDTEQYPRSCEELTNMFVQMHGGAQFRGNTNRTFIQDGDVQSDLNELVATEANPTEHFKLIPYIHSNPAYNADVLIYTNGTFTIMPFGDPATYGTNTTTAGWTPANTQYVQLGDLLFLVNSDGTHKPKVFYYDPVSSSGYRLNDIDRDYVSANPWKTVPWSDVHALDTFGNMIATYGANTVGSTVTLTSAGGYFFLPPPGGRGIDVGSYVRLCNGTNAAGVVRVTARTGPNTADAEILQVLPAASGFVYGAKATNLSFYQVSIWGNAVDGFGYPRSVTGFQGRVIYGGSAYKTDTIWGSRISNVFDFEEVPEPNTTGTYGFANAAYAADNSRPFTLTPNTAQSANIVTLSSAKTLNIHTDQAEIVAYGSNGALGPINVVFDSSTSFGASAVQPVRINNYSTYVQANGYKLRDLVYNFDQDQYKSQDLSFVADHMFISRKVYESVDPISDTTVDPIKELVRYEDRSSILLCKTERGRVFYVTLDRDYQVNAWGRLILGSETWGTYPYDNAPVILTMCATPVGGGTKIKMLVFRYINGNPFVTFEELSNAWELENPYLEMFNPNVPYPVYLDCATYALGMNADGSGQSTVWRIDGTGVRNFPGQKVHVLADGKHLGEFTPAGPYQEIEIPIRASMVAVGFLYKGIAITSAFEQGGQIGQPVGRMKRIDELVVRFFRTCGAKFGPSVDSLEEINFREPSDPMNKPPRYFTGDKPVNMPGDYNRRPKVVVIQDKPYPMYIIAISPRGQTND